MRTALLVLWSITVAVGAQWGTQPVALERLLRHPARVTAELTTTAGQRLGRYEVVPLWDVIRPSVAGLPDTVVRETVLVVTAANGARVVLALGEVLPSAALPPLLLLRRIEGRIGDTVRVPVRAGKVVAEKVEDAIAPAVRLRYRVQSRQNVVLPQRFPVLIVGADRTTLRWLPEVVRVDFFVPGREGAP